MGRLIISNDLIYDLLSSLLIRLEALQGQMTSPMIATVVDDPQQRAGTQDNRQAANISLDIRMDKFHCFSLHDSKEMEPTEVYG